MKKETLLTKRAQLLAEAEGLKGPDGAFRDDATRTAFDAKLAEIEQIDAQLRVIAATPSTPAPPQLDTEAIQIAERERIVGIESMVRVAKLEPTVAVDMVKRGLTLDAARAEVFAKLAAADAQAPPTDNTLRVEMGADARGKFLRGAESWLLIKGGAAEMVARAENPRAASTAAVIDPGEFRGMTLVDLARYCLGRLNVQVRGWDKMRIVSEAFMRRDITQSTSDFSTLLENVLHKVLQAAYATTPDTWKMCCAQSTVSDFRAHNRYRMGSFGALDTVAENGEFKNKAISDAEKGSITATTKGNIINVSRQMIINDDMGAFTRLLTMLGRAAALSVEVDVYAQILLNSGLGPTQSDGQPLFHANRSNVGSGAAISVVSIDADRVIMASQKDPWGNEYLDLRPHCLVVPIALGGTARVLNDAQYDPDTSNKLQMPNRVRGLFKYVIDTPRLTGTRRYMFADPAIAPTCEVAFLEGQSSPVLETQDGWRVDGAEMKVRFDYGVAFIDWRGAVTNAGA